MSHIATAPFITRRQVDDFGMFLMASVLAVFGGSLSAFLVLFLSKLHSRSTARERPLAALGEPLVPSHEAMTPCALAQKTEVKGVNINGKDERVNTHIVTRTLLSHVYLHASVSNPN